MSALAVAVGVGTYPRATQRLSRGALFWRGRAVRDGRSGYLGNGADTGQSSTFLQRW